MEVGLRLGLPSPRKTLTAWNENSRGQGLEIRRSEKSLSELALFSLKKRRSWCCQWPPESGGRGAEPLRWSEDKRQQSQAEMQGISIRDKEKLFSP